MNDLARTSLMFVVGLAGGVTGAILIGGDAGPVAGDDAPVSSGSSERSLRAVEQRLLALEGSAESQRLAYEELDGRLIALSRRPDLEQRLATADAAQSGEQAASAMQPAGPAMTAEVRAALQLIEEEERVKREAEQAQRREERVAALAERVSTELGLDAGQTQVVKAAINESWIAREAVFAEMRNGGGPPADREAIGQKMSELRATEIAQVSKVLTPAQVEQYSSLTSFGRGFGGDGGSRGGDGGRTQGGGGDPRSSRSEF
jgi:hypothetical protein